MRNSWPRSDSLNISLEHLTGFASMTLGDGHVGDSVFTAGFLKSIEGITTKERKFCEINRNRQPKHREATVAILFSNGCVHFLRILSYRKVQET